MPHLHPPEPRIPPHLSSEQQVLGALRKLPPDCHVFVRLAILDPETNLDRELDFLVLHPELGIVIVEVKGRGVEPRGDHWVRKQPDGLEKTLEETPSEQLEAQQYALLKFLHQANIGFVPQVTRVLALPMLDLKPDQDLGPNLPACRILTATKLNHPFLALREAVTGGQPWATWKATDRAKNSNIWPNQMDLITEALGPKLLPTPPLGELLVAEGRLQDVTAQFLLDHLAQNFARGRFHVAGAPGSGKSLLARQTTRLWAAEGRTVLMVAFNRALTHATQGWLDDLICTGQVEVSTFHDLAVNLLGDAKALPIAEDLSVFFNTDVPEALAILTATMEPRWDALVVDEAQDLDPAWVRSLLPLLRNPECDPVLIMEDPSQSLYRKGVHDLGQPWRLELSLRQHPILRCAAISALPSCGWNMPESQDEPGVLTFVTSSPQTWRRDLAKVLASLASDGVTPEQVLILAPHRPETLGLRDGEELGPWPINTQRDFWDGVREGHVRLGTVHAYKGLEADVVVYLAPAGKREDAGRLRYTALSRARHRAVVLEKAIPKPPKAEPPPKLSPPPTYMPPPPPVPIKSLPPAQKTALLEALSAAKKWKPGAEKPHQALIPRPAVGSEPSIDFATIFAGTKLKNTPYGEVRVGPIDTQGRTFSVLTTAYPMSDVELLAEGKANGMADLEAHIQALDWVALPCSWEDFEGIYPKPSWWVWDLPLTEALALAEQFQQRAICHGTGAALEVVFTRLHEPPEGLNTL